MQLDLYLALVLRLAAGILAIQDPHRKVREGEALRWATAAAFHAKKKGVDPFELIAIARNETDFRPHLVGPDGKDCGITQTRVTYSRYPCRELRRDTWIAFAEAARELAENQRRCLKRARHDLKRCRINSYNSGVRYAKAGWRGRYFLRVSCFAAAARSATTPRDSCRRVRTWKEVARVASGQRMAIIESGGRSNR